MHEPPSIQLVVYEPVFQRFLPHAIAQISGHKFIQHSMNIYFWGISDFWLTFCWIAIVYSDQNYDVHNMFCLCKSIYINGHKG